MLDIGCLRSVAGAEWAAKVARDLRACGRFVRIVPEREVFRFGDGSRRTPLHRMWFETRFLHSLAVLAFSIVDAPCPPMLPRQTCSAVAMTIDTDAHEVLAHRLGPRPFPVGVTPGGHYTVPIS